jgi:1-deoxy-D-xylulose-5-phosphate reductoisomerase
VEAFLEGRIPFPAIAATVEETLQRHPGSEPATIEEVIAVDLSSRELARQITSEARWRSPLNAHPVSGVR